jgi:hypothetical protein
MHFLKVTTFGWQVLTGNATATNEEELLQKGSMSLLPLVNDDKYNQELLVCCCLVQKFPEVPGF